MRFLLFVFLSFIFRPLFSQNLDERIVTNLNLNRNKNWDPFFQAISNSADYVAIATPATMLLIGQINKDKDLKRKGLMTGVAVVGTYGVSYLLKVSIKRDRPYVDIPSLDPIQYKDSYSMPSGSTSVAFATATSLTVAYPKWYVAIPSFTYASLVGYSRIRSGEHYPSDVLVGAAIGAGSVWVSHKLMKWINR